MTGDEAARTAIDAAMHARFDGLTTTGLADAVLDLLTGDTPESAAVQAEAVKAVSSRDDLTPRAASTLWQVARILTGEADRG